MKNEPEKIITSQNLKADFLLTSETPGVGVNQQNTEIPLLIAVSQITH